MFGKAADEVRISWHGVKGIRMTFVCRLGLLDIMKCITESDGLGM
jgi:hypothetical protein